MLTTATRPQSWQKCSAHKIFQAGKENEMRMQIFKIDQWTATPQEKHNSERCWSHENIILSFKCLNGSLAACTRQKRVGKILALDSLIGSNESIAFLDNCLF